METAHSVNERAVELLRGHLSPEQLAEIDTMRQPTAVVPPAVEQFFRWFNVTGSLGGKYTISGVLVVGSTDDPGYGAIVGVGADRPASDWCVHVFAWPGSGDGRRRNEWMPTADQMLAYKLALETHEAAFLHRACPTTDRASVLAGMHADAVVEAMKTGAL